MGSSLTAVRQEARVPSTDIFKTSRYLRVWGVLDGRPSRGKIDIFNASIFDILALVWGAL